MGELKFQKLTPTQNVDLSGYEEAFHYIFAEDDIRNIAISGAYSSGKSSVIESYKKKHPEKMFMHLSLAHFQAFGESDKKEPASSNLDDYENENTESVIEGKILNQLIQQIPADKIPQTNFRIKRSFRAKKPVRASFMICVFIALCLHYFNFNSWSNTVTGLHDGLLKAILLVSTQQEARIVSVGLMLIMLGIATFYLIKLQYSKNLLRKVSVQGNEIEIFAENNDSYFDKYLNEVLYLFENTGVDGIVFEDVDRFDNQTIFERLREINTLTNIRLHNNNDKRIRKPLRFFYLLRDDIFQNKDRTKFFDFILPIIPVLDSSNSYNKIKEYLEGAGLYSQFDDHFLRGVALYIDDLRIVKNIFNEFQIYNQKLNSIELDINKLFAIIVYKNIFPKDFADLQLNQGFVHTLFDSKVKLIADKITSTNKAIAELEERISRCENEFLEDQAELDIVKESKERVVRASSRSQQHQDYQEWYTNIYPKRKQALEDRKEGTLSELRRLVDLKKEEKARIENMQLADLLNRQNTNDAFRVNHINEIECEENFFAIKGNPYFPLLKYLISYGHIDESYFDYMTFFYPNSLSLRDKVFLRAVADRTGKQASYELDSPALVIENLNEYDFSQPETLNYTLSEYILVEGKTDYIRSMILQIASNRRFDYITGYLCSDRKSEPLVESIVLYWPEMFHDAWSSHKISDDLLKTISYQLLNTIPTEQLEKANTNDCLREFISSDPHYLCVDDINVQKVGSAFEVLHVQFDEIKTDGIKAELFNYVYDHNLYTINKANILMMIREKFSDENIDTVLPGFFTFILEQKECPFCGYLWESKQSTLSVYLDMFAHGIKDSRETILEVLNSDEIASEEKETYITRLETQIDKIERITDSASQKVLVANHKVDYSAGNILYYFSHNGLTEELISFINSGSVALDYKGGADEGVIDEFLNDCMQEESIDDTKYREIMGNICPQMRVFTIDGLSDNKLKTLIDLDLIEMNIENLRFVRTFYPDVVQKFIKYDFDGYLSIAVNKDFELSEALKILECGNISDDKKIMLLGQTTESINAHNKPYSDRLLIYILTKNFHEGDLPWILNKYSSFSEDVQNTVLQIAINQLARITSDFADKIDKTLLGLLYKSENVDFTEKVQLLEITAKGMSKYQLCTVLNDLGADKIADNINGGRRKVSITDENDDLLEALYSAGVIDKPERAIDGQVYKPIKYKK